MVNQTYYDHMIKPIIIESGECGPEETKSMARMKIMAGDGNPSRETKWFNVSRSQLKEILKILNTII